MIGKVHFTRAQLQWLTIYIDSRYKYSNLYIALSEISLKFERSKIGGQFPNSSCLRYTIILKQLRKTTFTDSNFQWYRYCRMTKIIKKISFLALYQPNIITMSFCKWSSWNTLPLTFCYLIQVVPKSSSFRAWTCNTSAVTTNFITRRVSWVTSPIVNEIYETNLLLTLFCTHLRCWNFINPLLTTSMPTGKPLC